MGDPFVNEKNNKLLCTTSRGKKYMITQSAKRATQPFTLWKETNNTWEKVKLADKYDQVANLIDW